MTVGILLPGPHLAVPMAFLLDQSVGEFQADPRIQFDQQQQAIWAQLRERIAPLLDELLQHGLVEREIGGAQ